MRPLRRPRPPAAPHLLAPLVDVITILLIFLLKSWSMDPPVRPGDDAFQLPASATGTTPPAAVAVDVTAEAVEVEGSRVAATAALLRDGPVNLDELQADLRRRAPGAVNLRVDADVPWRAVRRVMQGLREAGVAQVTLVARSTTSL